MKTLADLLLNFEEKMLRISGENVVEFLPFQSMEFPLFF